MGTVQLCHLEYETVISNEEQCSTSLEEECSVSVERFCNIFQVPECSVSHEKQCVTTHEQQCSTVFELECSTSFKLECSTSSEQECSTTNEQQCSITKSIPSAPVATQTRTIAQTESSSCQISLDCYDVGKICEGDTRDCICKLGACKISGGWKEEVSDTDLTILSFLCGYHRR